MINNKCTCGANKKITCSKCSRIKMVILLKHTHQHLKLKRAGGYLTNPVWYSVLSKNTKSNSKIIGPMLRRLESSKYKGTYNKVMFFDNYTNQEISI